MNIKNSTAKVVKTEGFRITVEEASQWSNLFKRHEGWTGADGIYSIPLSGYEAQGKADKTQTLFVFSDTFIGQIDQETTKRQNFCMINNSLALLGGDIPDNDQIRFIWGKNGDGSRSSVFTPETAGTKGKKCWYWLQDGVFLNGNVYILPMVIESGPSGKEGFKFRLSDLAMIKIPVSSNVPDLQKHTQVDTPFLHINEVRTLYFGAGIMPNTVEADAPKPDGYVYIYGRYEAGEIKLAVARVKPEDFEDFSKWRFWDGKIWSSEIADTVPLGRGGPELSVTPVQSGPLEGKYLMVSMHVERDLYIRIGESPVGPFSPRINIFRTSEPDTGQKIYTYNAKAHPNLSKPDEWLISYNVNSTDWQNHIDNGHIYRPRFLKVKFIQDN
ncbi:DUF4185 domain-containing protein [Candidatus Poribacteria bacterium]|nr:DUF4185 domain-containing protein [Candidatus Poribacteria bacterium]